MVEGHIRIETHGKYLGFIIGPGARALSWKTPASKFEARLAAWSGLGLGLLLNLKALRSFIIPVLSFVMQLETDPDEIDSLMSKAIRSSAPGPGSWISLGDAKHLRSDFSFPLEFKDLRITLLAIKL